MKLKSEDARMIVYDDHLDWKEVDGTRKVVGKRRWCDETWAVFQHTPSGKHYSVEWDADSTEMQDTAPFDCVSEVEFTEVEFREVTENQWLPLPTPESGDE